MIQLREKKGIRAYVVPVRQARLRVCDFSAFDSGEVAVQRVPVTVLAFFHLLPAIGGVLLCPEG
jgi:hypothetical protein